MHGTYITVQTVQNARYVRHNKLYKMHGTYITINCTKCTVRTSQQQNKKLFDDQTIDTHSYCCSLNNLTQGYYMRNFQVWGATEIQNTEVSTLCQQIVFIRANKFRARSTELTCIVRTVMFIALKDLTFTGTCIVILFLQ